MLDDKFRKQLVIYKLSSRKRTAILDSASFEPFATVHLALIQKAQRGFGLQSSANLRHLHTPAEPGGYHQAQRHVRLF